MNLHPLIGGTLALYQYQDNMRDSGGNGYDLSLVGGVEQYENLDTCIRGFTFNGATWMRSAVAPLLRHSGDHTIEVLIVQRQTFQQTFFKVDDHDSPSGGTVVWQYYIDASNHYAWSNQNGTSYLGFPGPFISCGPYAVGGTGNHTVYHFAFRKTQTGASQYQLECLINGVLAATATTFNATISTSGNECIWVGGYNFSSFVNVFEGAMASLRVLNYARSTANILADANYTLGVCGTQAVPPVTDGGTGASTFSGMVYDGVAAAQFATSLRQAPRS